MKRIISTLALAAPLATVALSLGAIPAMAQPADPIGDLKIAEINPDQDIPEDDLPQPEDPEGPEGPDEIKDQDPCPTHGPCGDGPDDKIPPPSPCSTPDDEPSDEPEEVPLPQIQVEKDPGDEDEPGDKVDIPRPNCIDAGAASTDEGMELAWLMAGGALITATGAAYAVRSRARTRA